MGLNKMAALVLPEKFQHILRIVNTKSQIGSSIDERTKEMAHLANFCLMVLTTSFVKIYNVLRRSDVTEVSVTGGVFVSVVSIPKQLEDAVALLVYPRRNKQFLLE